MSEDKRTISSKTFLDKTNEPGIPFNTSLNIPCSRPSSSLLGSCCTFVETSGKTGTGEAVVELEESTEIYVEIQLRDEKHSNCWSRGPVLGGRA
jgi:hypothetical protein